MPYRDPDQNRKYQREWRAARRNEWIASRGGQCARCGSLADLQVDHIDPALKTMNPTLIWSKTEEIREQELTNCQVLCKVCHDAKTGYGPKPHGTLGRYHQKCRCSECRAANAACARELRARKKER